MLDQEGVELQTANPASILGEEDQGLELGQGSWDREWGTRDRGIFG
jgi:hypothetical protein